MKKTVFLITVIVLPLLMMAQEAKKPKFGINFSGFVRNDMIYNTRQMVSARGESNVILAPAEKKLDKTKNNDINEAPNFNLIGFTTRLRGKITGPDAFGAKTSGMIEMDFLGPNGGAPFALRLRHSFMKLKWKSSNLLMGQYWHPMWATECYPGTVSFGAGVPFNPLSRNPQIRFTKQFGGLSVVAAAISQGMFKSKAGKTAHQNSGIPEMHLQLQYKNDLISAGAGFNYQVLMPRLATDSNYVTTQTVSSMSYFGYLKFKLKPVTIKLYGLYGQNNDNMVAMGGYAVTDNKYTQDQIDKNFVEYTPYNTLNYWADFESTGKKVKYGLFVGMSQNMGAQDSVLVKTYKGRWKNVNTMMRIAPRVKYTSGNVTLGFEIEYSAIEYAEQEVDDQGVAVAGSDAGGIDKFGKVTNFYSVDNIKALVMVAYKF